MYNSKIILRFEFIFYFTLKCIFMLLFFSMLLGFFEVYSMEKNLITAEILSKRWNLKELTLSLWRQQGRGPQYLKIGRRVMYRLQDIEEYEANNLILPRKTTTLTVSRP